MADDVEILVHVTAPALAVHDSRYRALASAYLGFKPESHRKLGCLDRYAREAQWPLVPKDVSSRQSPAAHRINQGSFQAHSLDSFQLSFSDAWDNNASPKIRLAHPVSSRPAHLPASRCDSEGPSSQGIAEEQRQQSRSDSRMGDSREAPPSEVEDSLPMNHFGMPEFTSPSRTIEHFFCDGLGTSSPSASSRSFERSSFERTGLEGPNRSIPTALADAPALVAATADRSFRDGDGSVISATPSTVLGTAPSSSDIDSDVEVVEDTILEGSPVIEQPKRGLPASPSRAASEPLPSKRQKRSPTSRQSPHLLGRSASDTEVHATRSPQAPTASNPLLLGDAGNLAFLTALEIQAPPPPVRVDNLTAPDLLTSKLTDMAKSLNMDRRFRPVEPSRDICPLERGYWLLDCSDWDLVLTQRTWGFLHNYVTKGLAGWGTRCVRGEDWGWIRTWCFGYVVGHIYLLLYAASEAKLKTAPATWVDGAGDTVLLTRGHE